VIDTSKPIKDVAHAYGVWTETLRNGLIKYREANGGTEEKLTLPRRARMKAVEREVQKLRAEMAFLKKPAAQASAGSHDEIRHIDRLLAVYQAQTQGPSPSLVTIRCAVGEDFC